MNTPRIRLYLDKRLGDGLSPSSVDRELNIIAATLNSARDFFPELEQWKVPKTPRPKFSRRRRERIITDDEYRRLVEQLFGARKDGEQPQACSARVRVGQIFRFAMLTGMRPKEIYGLKWADIDWDGGRIHVCGDQNREPDGFQSVCAADR